jgi:hypothetical protein
MQKAVDVIDTRANRFDSRRRGCSPIVTAGVFLSAQATPSATYKLMLIRPIAL